MPTLEATAGIPVHPLSEFYPAEQQEKPGYQDVLGVLDQDEVTAYVHRRKASEKGLPSDLKEGRYVLIYGALNLFLTVDSHVIKSLETAVDGNGYAITQAGLSMLSSAGLIID